MPNLRIIFDNVANTSTLTASTTAGSLVASNTLTFTVLAYFDNLGPRYSAASLTLHSATAYWRIRTPNAASSAAENNFSFNSYSYSLSSAQVLATGTLNWIAIGE